MGEWFTYDIKFANKEESLPDALISKGLAILSEELDQQGNHFLKLNLKKLNPLEFANGYSKTKEGEDDKLEYLPVSIRGNSICYMNKWVPDDRLADSISKCFPEDVLLIESLYTRGTSSDFIWYAKDGEFTSKNGVPVTCILSGLKNNVFKEKGQNYQISLPIGEEYDKWGRIYVPKDNVYYRHYANHNDVEVKYDYHVYFTNKKEKVYFQNNVKEFSVEEIKQLYYKSKNEYREKMSSPIELVGLPLENLKKIHSDFSDYYVVKIPCLYEVSSNGVMSITVLEYNIDVENGDVNLGEYGKERKVRITLDNGDIAEKSMSHFEIKQHYIAYKNKMNNISSNYENVSTLNLDNVEDEIEL